MKVKETCVICGHEMARRFMFDHPIKGWVCDAAWPCQERHAEKYARETGRSICIHRSVHDAPYKRSERAKDWRAIP